MDAEQLTAALVSIDSVNPDLVPGGAGEAEIAAFVAGWLADAGLHVEIDEAAPGRPSVIATARGTGGGRSLMLNAHMDTVGVDGMARPFKPDVRDGRLYGRGAYDMKGSLAACMLAAARVAREGLAGDVIVTGVCDEEYASIGMQSVLRRTRTDAAIVTEPTGLRVCVAHKGFVWAEIETAGRAFHGSRPDEGIDAITRMAPVLSRLAGLQSSLDASAAHPLVGPGSVHASLIEGGQELSSYPARCRLSLERRTIPGETVEDVRRECEALVEGVEGAELRIGVVREPFEVDRGESVVGAVGRAAEAVTGRQPEVVGDTPWMDAALTQAAGIPTVVFGPGGAGAHSVEEWVDLASVEACAEALAASARELCA
ncbi:MAG: acetylornithine deacetylase [Thermoleophilaceae bacterium]|nr:acetylornithine deacetylase [Thermoleophilaceae bacterium]